MAKSKKKSTQEVPDVQNFVAKHMNTFNKAATHVDRKKDSKNGKIKHKGRYDASFDVSKG
ncbi:hypothetical protein XbC2_47 [Xanthomonas phage XbC2]|nr:hypothetical protein XbC2_47 [Xanthomonas phage XbC2]